MTITRGPARVLESIPAPATYLCGLTWDGEYLWHSDQEAKRIWALDRNDGAVVRSFHCGWVRADLAFDGSMLCQVGGRPKRLVLVDRESGAVTGIVRVEPSSGRVTGAAMGPDGMWMCLRDPMVLQLRDYPALEIVREYPVPGVQPSGLTYAHGFVLYGEFPTGFVHAVDAASGRHVATTPVKGRPTGMTWDGERVWYCDFASRLVRATELDDLVR
jgi:hypothetical protein